MTVDEIPIDDTQEMIDQAVRTFRGVTLADREDMRSEAWLVVCHTVARFDASRSSWKAWVYRISRRAALRWIQPRRQRLECWLVNDLDPAPSDSVPSDWVVTVLRLLTDKQARTLEWMLALNGGFPRESDTVGEIIGITPKAVRCQKAAAIGKLRRQLSNG
jgi:DNA-directed RNA polymerase specialized sigma24 family protein